MEDSNLPKKRIQTKTFEYKQVLVIRMDLKMSRGKIAVQIAHAAVSAAEEARKHSLVSWRGWLWEGQKKVAVKVSSEEELLTLRDKAIKAGLPVHLIRDRGLTELPPGTTTALGIGPARTETVDKITGDLPLL
ncbi:MAG: peptidyl-tRNA hydrolase Pth2 [Candidatus Hermodarchaeota archaeon]|nr:peptidyl-tRNA hydrolase Pth2 [Candidatus Hermodarchaeota archaeon]